jgi:cation:H+ antiporter
MLPAAALLSTNRNVLTLLLVAGGWYVGSRILAEGLTGAGAESGPISPMRRGVGHWLPVAIAAVFAAARGESALALGLAFASSVACLSLALGVVTVTAGGAIVLPVEARRRWSLVLPAAVIVVLIGLRSRLNWHDAVFLVIEGMVLIPAITSGHPTIDPAVVRSFGNARRTPAWLAPVLFFLGLILAAAAGWFAVGAARRLGAEWDLATNGLVAAMLLGPALVVPMIGSGMAVAQRGQYWAVVSSSVIFVVLNLCVLIPLVIGIAYARPPTVAAGPLSVASTMPAPAEPVNLGGPLVFPMQMWRVDAILLVVLSLALLPLSMGRWTPGRGEGAALIVAFAVYLLMSAAAYTGRW